MNQSNPAFKKHLLPVRVYYEDTDAAGVVYYPNYLRFCERGRTEWLRSLGFDQVVIKRELDLVFVVGRVEADYLKSAELDDQLEVCSEIDKLGGASLRFRQTVRRGDEVLFVALVTVICVNWSKRRSTRLPEQLRALLDTPA